MGCRTSEYGFTPMNKLTILFESLEAAQIALATLQPMIDDGFIDVGFYIEKILNFKQG
jgi:hypothetical protein